MAGGARPAPRSASPGYPAARAGADHRGSARAPPAPGVRRRPGSWCRCRRSPRATAGSRFQIQRTDRRTAGADPRSRRSRTGSSATTCRTPDHGTDQLVASLRYSMPDRVNHSPPARIFPAAATATGDERHQPQRQREQCPPWVATEVGGGGHRDQPATERRREQDAHHDHEPGAREEGGRRARGRRGQRRVGTMPLEPRPQQQPRRPADRHDEQQRPEEDHARLPPLPQQRRARALPSGRTRARAACAGSSTSAP